MTKGLLSSGRGAAKPTPGRRSWKRKVTDITAALRELLRAVIAPGAPVDKPVQSAETLSPPPTAEPVADVSVGGDPWALEYLGNCTFVERVRKMDHLLGFLRRRSHQYYLRASWVLRHLERWAAEIVPGLGLESTTGMICSSALRRIAREIADEIRSDPREGIVIWVPSPAKEPEAEAFGELAKNSTPFVSGPQIMNQLHYWFVRVIPESQTMGPIQKTACGRVVMEAAWEIAETAREQTRDNEIVILVPATEMGVMPDGC